MFELFAALFLGMAVGVITGLLPGLHPNTLIPFFLALPFTLDPVSAVVMLVSAGVTNTFVNFIPSILIGAPEADSVMSVLPGHRLLLEGRGYEAIKLSVIGGLGATLFAILSLPLFRLIVPEMYEFLRPHLWWILSIIVLYMLSSENRGMKRYALLTMLLSGILGLIVLNNFDSIMLFPMLSGLFGVPLLLMSIRQKVSIPSNLGFDEHHLTKISQMSAIITGSLAGILAGLLPGVGSSQASVMAQQITDRSNPEIAVRKFLIAVGGVNASDFIYSLMALLLIGNPRSGIAVAIGQIISVDTNVMMVLIAAILTTAGFSAYLTLKLSRGILPFMRRLDYTRLCILTGIFITSLVLLFSGLEGILVLVVASTIGMVPNLCNIRKSHAMGCLLIPTILFFAAL